MHKKTIIGLIVLFILSFFIFSGVAYAAETMFTRLNTAAAHATYGAAQDPRIIIALIIKAVIGFVGLIFFVLIVVAGVSWMTSAGEAEKTKKAQEKIAHAAIGLLIVILAFAISSWLISTFVTATIPSAPVPAVVPPTQP